MCLNKLKSSAIQEAACVACGSFVFLHRKTHRLIVMHISSYFPLNKVQNKADETTKDDVNRSTDLAGTGPTQHKEPVL